MNGAPELPLRDIHLPPDPSWWPPAPGWWLLPALALLVAGAWAGLRYLRRRRLRSALSVARRRLDDLRANAAGQDPAARAREISVLMRRAAISFYPRRDAAALTGEAWLRFLDQAMEDAPFSNGAGRLLAEAPYRPALRGEDLAPLLDLCGRWLEAAARDARSRR